MQFKYYYHCVIASLDLWKSVFFYIQIYMKTFILTMYGRKEMERPDKKELIVSYEKSEWQLLQKNNGKHNNKSMHICTKNNRSRN